MANDQEATLLLINVLRKRAGLGNLRWEPTFAESARKFAERMRNEGFFGHEDFEERKLEPGWAEFGEVLYWGDHDLDRGSEAVKAWLNSPPHREVILGPRYEFGGVARVHDPRNNRGLWVAHLGGGRRLRRR